MAIVWTDEMEEQFDKTFAEIDVDATGALVFDEIKDGILKKTLQALGSNPTDLEVKTFIDQLDRDSTGNVSKDEFRLYLQQLQMKMQPPVEGLEQAMQVMMSLCDKNGNGYISKKEFKTFVQENGEEPLDDQEVHDLFALVDIDGDKETLNIEEVKKVLILGLQSAAQPK